MDYQKKKKTNSEQAIKSIYSYYSMLDLIYGLLRPGDLRVLWFVRGFHH